MRAAQTILMASMLMTTVAIAAQEAPMITGSATYRERMALPANAVFEAVLEDASRVDAPAILIKSFRKESPGNPPFQFTIAYDPKQIVENHAYVVRTRVTVDGKLLFTSTERNQVLTQGHGSEIGKMILMRMVASKPAGRGGVAAAAAQRAGDDEPLRETYWKLVELNGEAVTTAEHQREASLVFHTKDNRISGSGGCNRLMGSYMVEGSALHFKGVASTMMACQHGMETEQKFLGALNKVTGWAVQGKSLGLSGDDGKVLARFEAVALK
jgi:putative lipoprotein